MHKYACSLILLIGLFFTLNISALASSTEQAGAPPNAVGGSIDLRSLHWQDSSRVALDGEWEFYYRALLSPQDFAKQPHLPHHLVNVPGPWNNYTLPGETITGSGYATYRLVIYAPVTDRPLALKFSSPRTAHKLWANGKLVSEDGIVADDATAAAARFYDKVVPVEASDGRIELVLQVSNYLHHKGGPRRSVTLGDRSALEHDYYLANSVNIFTFGFTIAIGLFYSLFFFIRRTDKVALHFALFILTFSLRELTIGTVVIVHLLPSLSQEFVLRLEYMTMFSLVVYTWFVHSLLPDKIPGRLLQVIALASLLQIAVIAFAPVPFFTRCLPANQIFLTAMLFYVLFVIIKACWQKNREARLLLVGHLSIIIASVHDHIYYSDLIQTGDLFSLGFLILTITQAALVLKRFTSAFAVVEALNHKLSEMNTLKDSLLKQVVDSQRDLLLTQIKPHFFYNVINTIMGFCLTNPQKAYDLIGEFSIFISSRLQLSTIERFIELGEELTVIASYLKIEQARFGEMLRYELHTNVSYDYLISPLLIEPLVENAVKHGIREKIEGGCVSVSIETVEQGIKITVADDGVGMTPERLQAVQQNDIGIGLTNVRRRLQLDYNQPLNITSSPDGTTVWFVLPNETDKEDEVQD